MKDRIKNAINNKAIFQFINDPFLFGVFLKGGYEDLFSRQLFSHGFQNNSDLRPQYRIDKDDNNKKGNLDIAQIRNDSVLTFIEFGHQFSLQLSKTSAIGKLFEDGKKRLHKQLAKSQLFHVQIITDVVEINSNRGWYEYFKRYGIDKSLAERAKAEKRINEIEETVNDFNISVGVSKGLRDMLEINHEGGRIQINFLINGPYDFNIRSGFL